MPNGKLRNGNDDFEGSKKAPFEAAQLRTLYLPRYPGIYSLNKTSPTKISVLWGIRKYAKKYEDIEAI